jgi:hypothetical protein
VRVDYQGNGYVGGIRGLTGGNDVWRFDLNPNSAGYDPFLLSATPTFDVNGNVNNPSWKGQPDAFAPTDPNDLGADGGGDLELAVGFKPPVATTDAPTLATSSLLGANVSAQRSQDRGENFLNNPAGNTAVPVDDRNWMEFLGTNTVYLAYRELVGLIATSKYYVNRSDDGGLTYGPPVVAAVGGNTTGNIDIDQRNGTVYFCRQGVSANQVMVAVGEPISLASRRSSTTPTWQPRVTATTSRRCSRCARWRATVRCTSPTPMVATASTSRIPSITRGRGRRRCW